MGSRLFIKKSGVGEKGDFRLNVEHQATEKPSVGLDERRCVSRIFHKKTILVGLVTKIMKFPKYPYL